MFFFLFVLDENEHQKCMKVPKKSSAKVRKSIPIRKRKFIKKSEVKSRRTGSKKLVVHQNGFLQNGLTFNSSRPYFIIANTHIINTTKSSGGSTGKI